MFIRYLLVQNNKKISALSPHLELWYLFNVVAFLFFFYLFSEASLLEEIWGSSQDIEGLLDKHINMQKYAEFKQTEWPVFCLSWFLMALSTVFQSCGAIPQPKGEK